MSATIDKAEAPAGVELRVSEGPGGITICPIRKGLEACPDDPLAGPTVRVDFRVSVPEGVNFVARTVNGGIEARYRSGDGPPEDQSLKVATFRGTVTHLPMLRFGVVLVQAGPESATVSEPIGLALIDAPG